MPKSLFDTLLEEGKVKGKREAIVTILCRRFKMNDVPNEIKSGIIQVNEQITLESLLTCALDCQTLNEFAKALK